MKTIRKYHVFNPKGKSISTDCAEYANKKAILCGGQVYEDIRFAAKKRLQRIYFVLGKLAQNVDYPTLINQ